ncbi:hypothetical protein FXW78_22690 [Rhodococcus opacus]|nr:hypothetical protein [Rhodococcus opacus]
MIASPAQSSLRRGSNGRIRHGHRTGSSVESAVILDAARSSGKGGTFPKGVADLSAWPSAPGRGGRRLLRTRSSALVVGWIQGGGVQRNLVCALVLGAYDDQGVLRYVGQVGTGLTQAVRRRLREKLADTL